VFEAVWGSEIRMIHFLLTSTALIAQFLSHLQQSNYHLWDNVDLFNFDFVTYGSSPKKPDLAFSASSLTIVCSNPSEEAQFILKSYYEDNLISAKEDPLSWTINKPNISCLLLDRPQKLLWLIGDHVGASPLWFSFRPNKGQQEIIVTSDLFAAVSLGYTDLTAVGPGLSLAIDLQSYEISSINHWSQFHPGSASNEPQLENASEWSAAILASAQKVVSDSVLSPLLATELDLLDPSSILLECAIASQSNLTRARYHTAPLVIDSEPIPTTIDSYTQRESHLLPFSYNNL
jgi:hypothetical protein